MTTATATHSAGLRDTAEGPRLTLLVLMAVAAGLSCAGLYFAQPLIGLLRTELHMSTTTAGITVAMGQIGYAVGLGILVPLGDRYSRRALATTLLACTAVFVALAGSAPSGSLLLVATGLAAFTAVGAQVLVPFAAEISAPEVRARNLGIVMAGVVAGGLLGRALSGTLAEVAGWRSVYWVTAGMLAIMAYTVSRVLPADRSRRTEQTRPRRLWASTATLLAGLPALRRPVAVAAFAMASYILHLTSLTLLLIDRPYHWSPATIGLIGLVAVAGPLAVPFAGRLVDRGHARLVLVGGVALSAAAWLVMLPAHDGNVVWLVGGILVINVGQTAVLNAGAATSYELRPHARGQINAVFMTTAFVGGAAGGALAPVVWLNVGWLGTCVLGVALAGTGALIAARVRR